MDYAGLPRTTPVFLQGLAANNTRTWFEAHRAEYDADWNGAGLALIAALSPLCASMQPPLLAIPKLNQSLRRIHRDTRFSKDKRPYQPWLHVILSAGPAFNRGPGVHIVLKPEGLGYGAGQYGLEPAALDRMRRRLCDGADRGRLLDALGTAAMVGSQLDVPDLARTPKGYSTDPAWDHLLRRKNLIVRTQDDVPPPPWLFDASAPVHLADIIRAHLPVISWLREGQRPE